MANRDLETVRVFREAGPRGRLILDDGSRRVDLTAQLIESGQPTDLVGLFETGFFDEGELRQRLFGEGAESWKAVDSEWDGNALPEVATPIHPASVGKILCLGKNFRAHAEEFGEEVPEEPLFFNKLPETLVPHRTEVTVPDWYVGRVDHEAELAVIIGLEGTEIDPEDALEHVGGYTVANDLTARSMQGRDRKKGHPWLRSKNLNQFCPLGPCFVPRDFLDVSDLRVRATVLSDGKPTERQNASTRDFVVDVPSAIAWLSRHITLRPGDLILMGTPAGVGPLEDGDQVLCSVDRIGELATTIRRSEGHD